MARIGIFGGAFNPPHKEHIRICNDVAGELSLDKVVLVPSGFSPHKEIDIPYELRRAMLSKAIESSPKLVIDDIENSYGDRAYSVNILLELQRKYGDIVFIIGGDSLMRLHTWYRPRQLVTICPIAVVPRGEVLDNLYSLMQSYNESWGADISILSTRGEDISSSMTRAMIELDMDTSALISVEIAEMIKSAGIYRNYSSIISRVKSSLSDKKWKHVCGVVISGLRINQQLGLPVEKVFLACLLHDCMKEANIVHRGVPMDVLGSPVMHAFNGAIEAAQRYGIDDDDIINAVRYHTTGRARMSKLEKVVYVADMIEPNRHYEGCDALRRAVYSHFETGFKECVAASYDNLKSGGKPIYYLTIDCYLHYCKGEKE